MSHNTIYLQSEISIAKYLKGSERPLNPVILYAAVWVIIFALYLPAAKAGFVTDFTGWLDQVRNHSFSEHVNRTNFHAHSLYQVTQLMTYVLYHLFGISALLWHLLFVSLHALNVVLCFRFCESLFRHAGSSTYRPALLAGILLYSLSPYMSEVIVWEPAFHFLTGMLFIWAILLQVQHFFATRRPKHVLISVVIYAISTLTLEVFYITPWLVLAAALFYQSIEGGDVLRKTVRRIFLPMLVLFLLRLFCFYAIYGSWVSRIGDKSVSSVDWHALGKPAKYLFHLLFAGRFFAHDARQSVYSFCDSAGGIVMFYGIVVAMSIVVLVKWNLLAGKVKAVLLLFCCMMVTLTLLIPVWFGDLQLVLFDRYTYFTAPFLYVLLATGVFAIPRKSIRYVLLAALVLVNLRFTILVSRYWGKSERVVSSLLHNLPNASGKTVLLLNLPENLHGVAMIGSEKESEYRLMRSLLLPQSQTSGKIYDVLSYNMSTPEDGAYVTVANDSALHVTLSQWGTWWWYEGKGGHSYENNDYRVNLIDPGHWYELVLKHPKDQYLLLYSVGGEWKTVDMDKVNTDQR